MKKSDELKQKRYLLMTEIRTLGSLNLEEREFQKKETELSDKIHALSGEIIEAEIEEKKLLDQALRNGRIVKTADNDIDKYSFARAIRVAAGYEKGGLEEELSAEAQTEARNLGHVIKGFGIPSFVLSRASSGQNVTTSADGGILAANGPIQFIEALKNKLSLVRLGATFLTGLQGNVPLVGGSAFSASFVDEGEQIPTTKMGFSDRGVLKPKRFGATGAISKELIFQSSIDVERIIVNALTSAMAQALEDKAINGSGNAPYPTGLLNTLGVNAVVLGDNGLQTSWPKVVELETKVLKANGHGTKMGYLTNSSVIGSLKTLVKSSGSDRFILEDALVNGYVCLDSNAVPSNLDKGTSTGVCSAMIFGAWEALIIGQWGGLDLIVDPYSRKSYGEIELNTTQFIDIGVTDANHFAICKDILT